MYLCVTTQYVYVEVGGAYTGGCVQSLKVCRNVCVALAEFRRGRFDDFAWMHTCRHLLGLRTVLEVR